MKRPVMHALRCERSEESSSRRRLQTRAQHVLILGDASLERIEQPLPIGRAFLARKEKPCCASVKVGSRFEGESKCEMSVEMCALA